MRQLPRPDRRWFGRDCPFSIEIVRMVSRPGDPAPNPELTRLWRAIVAMLLGAVLLGAGMPVAPKTPAVHDHSAAGDHHHGPPVGGPATKRSASLANYFGSSQPDAGPTKGTRCDQGSMPEDVQGKVPAKDYKSGRAAKGYYCNARL